MGRSGLRRRPTNRSTSSGARKVPPNKDIKVTSEVRVEIPSTPRRFPNDVGTDLQSQSPRKTPPTSRIVFDPAPDFSSPSTDHIGTQKNLPAGSTPSGGILKLIVKNGISHIDNESGTRPAGPQTQLSTKPPVASDHAVSEDNNQSIRGRVVTRSVLKNVNPNAATKRELKVGDMRAARVAKRPKLGDHTPTSADTANAPSSPTLKQSQSASIYESHQHPYSPTAKRSGTFGQQRKRSQPPEVDRYEIRFRQ